VGVVNGTVGVSVAIVSPGFPDVPGGVTDHTARLVRHWSAAGREPLVWSERHGNAGALAAAWRRAGHGAILIQYVPFLYGRRGLSSFPRRLARAGRATGLTVGVFVHEPWVPRTRLPWLVLSPLQRGQLLRLLAACDAAFTPVPAWRSLLDGRAELIPVGSTLGEPRVGPGGPPLAGPVVFSPFAAGLNWEWIVAAAQALGAEPRLSVIGATWEQARAHYTVGGYADPAWDWRGRLPAAEVLDLLRRARLVLAPFTDGLTTRRTSAMAALSVGTRVVSSTGPLFDERLADAGVALAADRHSFVSLARAAWQRPDQPADRAARLSWYERTLDPRRWDDYLLRRLLTVGAA
jgi:glycosyltransferase involved in cell wall biosynthesis